MSFITRMDYEEEVKEVKPQCRPSIIVGPSKRKQSFAMNTAKDHLNVTGDTQSSDLFVLISGDLDVNKYDKKK